MHGLAQIEIRENLCNLWLLLISAWTRRQKFSYLPMSLLCLMFKFTLLFIFTCAAGFAQTDSLMGKGTPDKVNPSIMAEETYSISITVRNIRNKNGVIRFKFYNDDTRFPHDYGFLKEVVSKSDVRGDSLRVTFHGFKAQHMAIALLDDENNNVKLDFGWFFPKEGHAFSDYYHAALRRPVYEDFAFILTGDKEVIMKMRYY